MALSRVTHALALFAVVLVFADFFFASLISICSSRDALHVSDNVYSPSVTSAEIFASKKSVSLFNKELLVYSESIPRHASLHFGASLQALYRKSGIFKSRGTMVWLSLLLILLSGSVHPNPGPTLLAVAQPDMELSMLLAEPLHTPADGHCLLHAVSQSFSHYLKLRIPVSHIAAHTRLEINSHLDYYACFLTNNMSLATMATNYFDFKVWNSDLGDILPLAVANTFTIKIVIIRANFSPSCIVVEPRLNTPDAPYIIIHLANSHFSATHTRPRTSSSTSTTRSTATSSSSPMMPTAPFVLSRTTSAPTTSIESPRVTSVSTTSTVSLRSTSAPTASSGSPRSTSALTASIASPCSTLTSSTSSASPRSASMTSSALTITHCNCQGLLGSGRSRKSIVGTHKKLDAIRDLLSSQLAPGIFCVSESKLGSSIDDSEISVKDFTIFRADRNRNGGGVLIFCNQSLRPKRVLYDCVKDIEYVCIKVSISDTRHLLVCSIYRPPSAVASWRDAFFSLTDNIMSSSTPCIITGDFNVDLLCNSQLADDLAATFDLKQHIATATRITATSATLIDHIYSHGIEIITASVSELHIADHCSVSCTVKLQSPLLPNVQCHKYSTFRSFKRLNQEALTADLTAVPWASLLQDAADVNTMVTAFNNRFLAVWNKHCPINRRRVRKHKTPWMSDSVLQLMHARDVAYKQYQRASSATAQREYKTRRNAVTDAIRKAKRYYFMQGARSGGKHFWQHIKQCTGLGRTKRTATPWPCHNTAASKASADRLNNNFVDSIAKLIATSSASSTSLNNNDDVSTDNILSLHHVTTKDVKRIIDAMPHSAVVGNDLISATLLKKSPLAVFEALATIFNHSLTTGCYPDAWKSAIVVPVHKKGDIYCLDNYRPISLLPVISKVFERLVNEQLHVYLLDNNFLSNAQHGFRAGRSCETAALQLSKNLFSLKASNQFVYLLAIDFSRAFDTLNLKTLLHIINGFSDSHTATWFASFLLDRQQCTKYCDVISGSRSMVTGVPQGSVLGPALFIVYLNDLLIKLQTSSPIAYADDVTLLCHGATPAEAAVNAERAIALIAEWSAQYGLVLSASKSQALFISPYSRKKIEHATVLVNGSTRISVVEEVRVLGVTIVSGLTWSVHARRTQQSVARMVGVLNRFGSALNTTCRRRILQAFILPKLNHCTPVWCWLNKGSSDAFDITLQRAGRIVLRDKSAVLNRSMYEATGLIPINILAQIKSLVRVHALLSRDDCEAYLPPIISQVESQHATRSASGRRLQVPVHVREADKKCFHYAATQLWNSLPWALTSSPTMSSLAFSNTLFKHLFSTFN